MEVRMNVAIPARGVDAGDIVDVSAHEAEMWLLNGNASSVDAPVEVEEVEEADEDVAEEVEDADEEDAESEDFFDIN